MKTQGARQQQLEIHPDEGQNGWNWLSEVLDLDCSDLFCKDACELLPLKRTYGHQEKGVCIKCTPYLASCVVQIELGSDRPMVLVVFRQCFLLESLLFPLWNI